MSKVKKIAIIDYQMSNLFSVQHACEHLHIQAEITSDPQVIAAADGAILPGVGAFADAMKNLNRLGLDKTIKAFVSSGKPLIGVCLGMQLLMTSSEEFGLHSGLDIIKGEVKKIPSHNSQNELIKIPQIGWNKIYQPPQQTWLNTPLAQVKNNAYMYFVHSFCVFPKLAQNILSLTNYGGFEYCSSMMKDNVFAAQYHPEKSGPDGISIYQEWFKQI